MDKFYMISIAVCFIFTLHAFIITCLLFAIGNIFGGFLSVFLFVLSTTITFKMNRCLVSLCDQMDSGEEVCDYTR